MVHGVGRPNGGWMLDGIFDGPTETLYPSPEQRYISLATPVASVKGIYRHAYIEGNQGRHPSPEQRYISLATPVAACVLACRIYTPCILQQFWSKCVHNTSNPPISSNNAVFIVPAIESLADFGRSNKISLGSHFDSIMYIVCFRCNARPQQQ